jgi:F-type H+-transporting ATPase subunit delta
MSAVGRRYAKALFALAKERNALEPTAEQVERVAQVVSDPSVGPVFRSPLLAPQRRGELAGMLSRALQLSELLTHFLHLLAGQQRLGELPSIVDHFERLLDQELGRVRITVCSATPLAPQQQEDIVATFAMLTAKRVLPRVIVDPELLGGVAVEVAGKVYDGSVRTQLHRLAKELAGTVSV